MLIEKTRNNTYLEVEEQIKEKLEHSQEDISESQRLFYEEGIVNIEFLNEGKKLEDLLINFFKTMKVG